MESLGRTPNTSTVERDEHVHNVLRLRKAGIVGLIAWTLFGVVDWFIVSYVEPGRLWFFLVLRALGLILLGFGVLKIYERRLPSPLSVRIVDCAVTSGLAVLITISCYEFQGIDSPLALGVVTVLIARSAVLNDHWRRGLLPVGLAAVAHPMTLVFMGALFPELGAQFADSEKLAGFLLNQMFVFGAASIILVSGHIMWGMKRQVFEARSLGRYRLKRRIGVGGMGEVWSAHHNALKRDVAVKILRPENNCDETAVARFEREVHATSELKHPHTVRVFDYGVTDDGLWYYAMELLEGRDCLRMVQSEGPIESGRAIKLVWQTAKALAEAHGRGITHRDVKPENLFVTSIGGEGDFVKVLDFGLAKLAEGDGDPNLTSNGWAVGTPKYVSPEVAFGHPADARSDVYALGAVLYFLLCGSAPFEYDDMRQTLAAHMREAVAPPSERIGRRLPAAIEAVVMRCLAKDPRDRYADAAELARALEQAAAEAEEEAETRVNTPQLPPAPEVAAIDRVELVGGRVLRRPFPGGSRDWPEEGQDTMEQETRVDDPRLPLAVGR